MIPTHSDDNMNVRTCVICKCNRSNIRFPCNHYIHARCFYPWPISHCPFCQESVTIVAACDIEPFHYDGNVYYPPQNIGQINLQRSGRWTQVETDYARLLMEGFFSGMLPLGDKTNLGGFLNLMLLCNAARLSSKLRTGKVVISNNPIFIS